MFDRLVHRAALRYGVGGAGGEVTVVDARGRDGAAWLVGAVVVGAAIVLRWHHGQHAISSDEVAILRPWSAGGVWALIDDPESAMNPPLHRVWLGLFGEEVAMARAGRALSWICGVLSVPAAYLAASRLGGGRSGGLLAALLVGINPLYAMESTMVRAYPAWVLAQLLRLGALGAMLGARDGETPRGARRLWWALTIALPWLHYGSWPLLALEGLALWGALGLRWIGAHGAAAVGSVPLWALVWRWRASVVGGEEDILEEAWWLLTAGHDKLGGWALGILVLGVLGAWRGSSRLRAASAMACAAALSLLVLAMMARVRLPIALLGLPTLAVLVAVLPSRWPGAAPWIRGAVAAAYLAWWPQGLRDDLRPRRYPADLNDGIQAFARAWDARPDDTGIYPFHQLWVVRFHLLSAGRSVRRQAGGQALEVDGWVLSGLRRPEQAVGAVGWMSCEPWPDRCRAEAQLDDCVAVLRCDVADRSE